MTDRRSRNAFGASTPDTAERPAADDQGARSGSEATRQADAADHSADRRAIDAALRESEAPHRLLLGSLAQAVWETDAAGVVVADSPSWRAYTGQTLEEWLGYGWLDAIHPDDRGFAERQWREAMAARSLVNAEFRLRAPDGGYRWTNVRAAPVLATDGSIEKWAGVNIDIDASKRAEAALRESEVRQRFLLEVGDALRVQPDATGMIEVAARLLGERLKASRVLWAEYDWRENVAHIFNGWFADGAQPFPTAMRLEDYDGQVLDELRAGRMVRVDDVDALADEPGYAAIAQVGVQALLSPPLLVGGELKVNLSIHQHEPRRWTDEEVALVAAVAERLWAEVVHARAEAALRASEEKYRSLFETMGQGYCELELLRDEEGRAVDQLYKEFNPAFERLFGIAVAEAKGCRASEVFPGLESHWTQAFDRVARTGVPERIEHAVANLNRWFEVFAYPGDGDRVIVLYEEITERKRAEETLRESEERLRRFGEASQDILWIRDAETLQWTYLTPGFEAIYGLTREEALSGDNYRNWQDLILSEDREKAVENFERVRAGEHVFFEYRIRRRGDGAIRTLRNTDFPIRDAAGKVVLIAGIGHDATDIRAGEQRQKLLLAELQHRVRNILGMIRSIVRQSSEGCADLDEFTAHLVGRLDAMARTQVLLTRSAGAKVDLEGLVWDELQSQLVDEQRTEVRGPAVGLSAKAAEVLTLALHELATNSTKYGALSDPGGRLAVTWGVAPIDGAQWLHLTWEEHCKQVEPQAIRAGFGTELIEARVPYELHGEASLHITGGGVRAEIAFPLTEGTSILETRFGEGEAK